MTQAWTPAPVATPRGRGALITGLVLLLVGIVVAVVGIVGFGSTASSLISGLGSPQPTPAKIQRTFDAGTTYAVYEQVVSGSGTTSDRYLGIIRPGEITVTATDGSSLLVKESPTLTQTFSDGKVTYIAVATFDPPATGDYVVDVTTDGATVLVAPSVTAVAKALPWIAAIGLGALLGLVGLVLLIVGIVRRGSGPKPAPYGYAGPGYAPVGYPAPGTPASGVVPPQSYPAPTQAPVAQPAPAPTGLPPAGWYPDPERPGGRRYWSGTGWTDNRA